MRSSKYDKAALSTIVESSRSTSEVLRKLGLPATGGNYRMIATRIRQVGLDVSHFAHKRTVARLDAVSRQDLALLVPQCLSIAQVLVKLELPTEGRSHRELTRRIKQLGIDTAHFRGQGWSRGETTETHASVARATKRNRWPDAEVFVENSPVINGQSVVRRVVALGWLYECSWCGIAKWRGERLVLHLDHINGVSNDNRLANLRFLCPNCHSQTETYGSRNRRS